MVERKRLFLVSMLKGCGWVRMYEKGKFPRMLSRRHYGLTFLTALIILPRVNWKIKEDTEKEKGKQQNLWMA
jgi:hypothetical protein